MAIIFYYFIAQEEGIFSPPPPNLEDNNVESFRARGRSGAPVGEPSARGGKGACGRPVLCWAERLGVAEAPMQQALGTWKVCLSDVLFLLGPVRHKTAALNPILQAIHITGNCWVPFCF